MTKYWTVWVAALGLAAQSEAAVVEVNLTAPLSSAVYSVQAVDAQTLELSVAAPSFVVAEGDTVEPGGVVATIEAMKMEANITSPVGGTVARLAFSGHHQQVEGGDLIVVVTPA